MRIFDPWVGNKYWAEGFSGVRILILGESHYGEAGTETNSFTKEIIKEWAQEKRSRFFTVVQKLISGSISGDWVPNEQRAEFWEHVAFYNFVQTFPSSKPRQRPTPEMWAAASSPFLFTLQELKPQLLIVLGYELGRNLPEVPASIRACTVQHPSSCGFQYKHWQPAIQSVLQSVISGGTTCKASK